MRKQTNMQEVKALARSFLMFDPEPTELSPLVVKHPFTDSGIVGIRTPDGEYAIGNIMENPEDCLPFAQKIFPEAVCGTDGMKITLRYSDDMPLPHIP